MDTQVIPNNVAVLGNLSAPTMSIPAAAVKNAQVASDASIGAEKLRHRFRPVFAQEGATTAAAEKRMVHHVVGATAIINSVKVGAAVSCIGDSTITVDVKKNSPSGTSVLSAPITLDSASTAHLSVDATISLPNLVTTDKLYVVVTVSAGTGTLGKGVYCAIEVDEDPV